MVGVSSSGSQSLLRPADGSNTEKLAEFQSATYGGLDWTADGRALIYGALGDNGRMQLFTVPRPGGPPRQLTHDDAGLMHPQISPDNRFIAATRTVRNKELRRLPLR
jgi:Tol biopolymer transport system component